jgi:uncharacterized OB-fold protein
MNAPDRPASAGAPKKPVPVASPESTRFWQEAKGHRLVIPRCNACGKFWFPPSRLCPLCLSGDVGWETVSGRGHIYSFVVFHRVYHPAFAGEVPYVVAIVELEEGPRMLTNIVGVPVDQVRCNMPVAVVFDDVSSEIAVPKFTPRPQPPEP